jgi:tRNA A-37 threonylcarbamoyl transferase component Bud32
MQYIASHTTVPVPKIYATHTDKRYIYIEMAYIPGDTLERAWAGLSTDERNTILADIKYHVSCLRELQPPAQDIVCSASQNPAYDCRIGFQFFGPMTHDEFHSLARKHLLMEDVKAGALGTGVATTHTSRYRTCFTHADLAPRNIIVRRGRVAAIIDWGFAGWYPEYWEFTKAHYNYFSEDWEECLKIAVPSYSMELAAEQTLWRILPEPGSRSSSFFRDGTRFEHKGSEPSKAWLAARAGRQLADLWSLALAERASRY